MMEHFPCPLERSAASALLLLSHSPTKLYPANKSYDEEERNIKGIEERSISEDSKASSSNLTSEGSSEEVLAQGLRIISIVARHEFKLQVERKSRSETICVSDTLKTNCIEPKMLPLSSASTEASCLSSSSTAASSIQSFSPKRGRETQDTVSAKEPKRKQQQTGSTHMQRRANAILKLLSRGCASEVKIRQVLGDSPDTSKALRMLLKIEEVKRSGSGGRQDPYIYMIA